MNGIGGFGGRNLANLLGSVGVWSFALQRMTAADEIEAARQFESLGYPATWIPESLGSKDVLVHSGLLLANTSRMVVAPGIANIHARDPMAMANGAKTLGEAYPNRFVLGIGVSHAPSVAMRGGDYANPIAQMTAYLDAMDAAQYGGPLAQTARAADPRRARTEDARARRRTSRRRPPILRARRTHAVRTNSHWAPTRRSRPR